MNINTFVLKSYVHYAAIFGGICHPFRRALSSVVSLYSAPVFASGCRASVSKPSNNNCPRRRDQYPASQLAEFTVETIPLSVRRLMWMAVSEPRARSTLKV
jgi:hypothetical protein